MSIPSGSLPPPSTTQSAPVNQGTPWMGVGIRKIAGGVLCSIIATAIWNIAPIKRAVLYACSAVVHIGGDPLKGEDGILTKVETKLDKLADKAAEKRPHVPSVPVGIGHKTPEQLKFEADRKEQERARREESERKTLLARAAVVKFECDKEWTLERLRIEVPRAEEELKRKPWYDRADKAKLRVEPSWSLKELQEQVEGEEEFLKRDADYQAKLRAWRRDMDGYHRMLEAGPNARCPKCRNPFRTRAASKSSLKCLICAEVFSAGKGRALWTPPAPPREPTPPKKNPGLMKRIFG